MLLVYAVILYLMPKHVFWSPDEGGKFLEMHSLRWQDGLTYTVPYGARGIDPHLVFYPRVSRVAGKPFPYPPTSSPARDRFYWPIWFPLLSGFMLWAFGLTGIYVIPLLSGWLIAVVSGRITHFLNPQLAPLAILLVGFATPVFFYSQCFWEHTLATALAMLAVAILVTARPGSVGALVAMLPPLLAAMMLRIEMVAFAAAIFLAWGLCGLAARAQRSIDVEAAMPSASLIRRSLPGWGPYLLLVCLVVGAFSVVVITAPTRQRHFVETLPARAAATWRKLPQAPRSLVSILVSSRHQEGPDMSPAWVMLGAVAVALCLIAPFLTSVRAEAAVIVPALVVMTAFSATVLFRQENYRALHGIFPVAPFSVIWAYALADAWRRRDWPLLMLAQVALLYLILGCAAIFVFYVGADGRVLTGLEWGQRYMLTLYPILAGLSLLALYGYRQSTRPAWLRSAFAVLVSAMMIIGVQQEIRGLAMMRFNRTQFALWDRLLRSDGPVVTDWWWLPATLAPFFVEEEMLYVRNPAELAKWVPSALAHGISRFTFVSFIPVQERQLTKAGLRRIPEDSQTVFGLQLIRLELVASSPAPP